MNKGNLLFVSAHLPSMNVPQAGQKIAYQLLKQYAELYHVYVVSFCNEVEKEQAQTGELDFCEQTHLFEVTRSRRILSALTNIHMPLRAAVRVNRAAINLIVELQRTVRFDVAHFEFTSAAFYLSVFNQPAHKVITEHDITFQSLERKRDASKGISRLFYRLEAARQKKWELKSLAKADEIIVLCGKDRLLLVDEGVADAKIRVQAPVVDPVFRQVGRSQIERHTILFWGAMDRAENNDAMCYFIGDIFPVILLKYPDVRLFVVGANPTREICAKASTNVLVTGFVDNPLEYFEKCQVAVAPLRMGAGIKIKVLEYLEAGIPVVASPIGAEGIEHERLFVAEHAKEFSCTVLKLFEEHVSE